MSVWHTPHEFTLDFGAILQAEPADQMDDAPERFVLPALVTARVKIPPTVVFDLLRALNENLTIYETNFGPINRPGPDEPTFPPDDMNPEV